MEKKVVIFLAMHLPSMSVPEAGQKISYNNLSFYLKNNYDVYLISFYNDLEGNYISYDDYKGCTDIFLFKVDILSRVLGCFLNFSKPSLISFRYSRKVKKIVEFLISKHPSSLLHIEYEQGIQYIPKGFENTKVVFHDIISQSLKRFYAREVGFVKKYLLKNKLNNIITWERYNFDKIKHIDVLNEKDKAILVNDFNIEEKMINVSYPVVSEDFYKCTKVNRVKQNIIFWGAMNRIENIDAVLWFSKNILPKLKNNFPDIKFYIVGANPTKAILDLQCGNVIVTGFVENPIEYFEICSICVVPLRFGAGIKIKVLEALASEMIVVSTDVGAEGVVDQHNLLKIANDEDDFFTIINKIIVG